MQQPLTRYPPLVAPKKMQRDYVSTAMIPLFSNDESFSDHLCLNNYGGYAPLATGKLDFLETLRASIVLELLEIPRCAASHPF